MRRNSPSSLNSPENSLMPETEEFVATGRRKTSVARIRMTPGTGKIDINGRSFEDYFPTVPLQNVVLQPLQTAKAVNAYDCRLTQPAAASWDRLALRSLRSRVLFFRSMSISEAR